MKRKVKYSIIFFLILICVFGSAQASAKVGFYQTTQGTRYYNASGNLVKGTWFKVGSYWYYSDTKGYLAKGLKEINGKLYYFLENGRAKIGWAKINGKKYYFLSTTREAIRNKMYTFKNGRTYLFDSKGIMKRNWQVVNGKYYYFKNYMKTGWLTISGKKYYLYTADSKKGQRATGLVTIGGKKYYFNTSTGVMAKDTTITVGGVTYNVDENGVCKQENSSYTPSTSAPSKAMLFFLTFESGSEAYNQTGGDGGNACGAYQFDYRYSLLPLVKYAYKQNPTLCAEFKKYAELTTATSLKSNKKFYKAWNTIYERNPSKFSKIQDNFAKENYYLPAEKGLLGKGIDISKRPDIIKGAVYSYSIQHGSGTAVNAVKDAGITNTTSNAKFLTKLYNYRIKKFPAYKTRYNAELQKAQGYL